MKKIATLLALTTAAFLFAASATSKEGYYASSKSTVYHLPTCDWAMKISPANLIVFKTKEEAQKKGYHACNVCKP